MEKFELPVITVVALEADDIICTSSCENCIEYGTESVTEVMPG